MTADQDVNSNMTGGSPAFNWALAAMLYNANILGLSTDYAYPEGPNVSASRYDQITTLAKVLTRKHTQVDGNSYDIWDAVQTILKWVLTQNPHINDTEVQSANYKKPSV